MVIVVLLAFAGGLYVGRRGPTEELKIKTYQYDKLQREYNTIYLEQERRLKSSELERNRLSDTVDSLDLRNKVLYDSLKRIPDLGKYREKLKTLTSKQLEELMTSEFKSNQ